MKYFNLFSEHTQFDYEFTLPKLIVSIINEKSNSVQLQIRFGKELPGMSELSEGLPKSIQIAINSHIDTAKDSPINYSCNLFLFLNDTKNRISILWPHCKTPYYMTVNIVESITIADLVKRVQFNNKLCSITLNTKAKAMELLKNGTKHSDVEFCDSQTLKLSLLCPITKLKMELPTRSLKCSHLQCFDLHALFSLNMIKPTWKCPICYIRILVNELVVDSFFLDIINSSYLPENCFQIIFFKNGNWEPYIEPKKEILDDQSESDETEHSTSTTFPVDLGNYNDENIRD